MEPESEKTNIK